MPHKIPKNNICYQEPSTPQTQSHSQNAYQNTLQILIYYQKQYLDKFFS